MLGHLAKVYSNRRQEEIMEYKSNYGGIDFEKKDHVAYLTFNNPQTLNALSYSVFMGIREVFGQMSQDKDVWGVILTGTGRSFIAGADLSDGALNDANDGNLIDLREQRVFIHETMNVIAKFERPTIAAVNGYALGGGAELALCCDFRIGSAKAKVGFPETKLGGIPGYGGPTRAVRIMGITNAKEMLFTGAHFKAEDCLRLGFFSKVVDPEELMPTCDAMMAQIVAQAPIAVRYSKFLADRSVEMSFESALEFERFVTMTTTETNDFKEGMKAFHEKRNPVFNNS